MPKSKTHIKRRKTSKKKRFLVERNEIITPVKALDSRCALHKVYRRKYKSHEIRIENAEKTINRLFKFVKRLGSKALKQKEDLAVKKEAKINLENNFPEFYQFKIVF